MRGFVHAGQAPSKSQLTLPGTVIQVVEPAEYCEVRLAMAGSCGR